MNDDDDLRRTIRDAMTRLVEGHPIRSDGRLTVKSLAEEAGVKRWLLTHKYTDLQEEFKARIKGPREEPHVVLQLREQLTERNEVITRLRSEIRELTNDRQQLERVINVLALELRDGRNERPKIVDLRGTKQ